MSRTYNLVQTEDEEGQLFQTNAVVVVRKEFHVHLSSLAITSRNFQVKKSTTSGFQHLILRRAGRCTIPHSHTHSTFAQKRLIKKAIDYPRRRSFLAANQAYEIIKKARKGRTSKEREQDNCTGTKLVKFLAIVLHAGKGSKTELNVQI